MKLTARPFPPSESEQSVTLAYTLDHGTAVELVYAPDRATVEPVHFQQWLESVGVDDTTGWPAWAATVSDVFYDTVLPIAMELTVTTEHESCYTTRHQPHLDEEEL